MRDLVGAECPDAGRYKTMAAREATFLTAGVCVLLSARLRRPLLLCLEESLRLAVGVRLHQEFGATFFAEIRARLDWHAGREFTPPS